MARHEKEKLKVRVTGKRILRTMLHLGARPGGTGPAQEYAGDEPPLRSELFSSEQMKRHGKALAISHKLSPGHASDRLLTRLAENEDVLILVVVPTMLTSTQSIETMPRPARSQALIEALEVRFLANRDDHLHFGLLTDFRDAIEEALPEDEPLLRLARQRVEDLNDKYRNPEGDTFFLFHRPRRWNPLDRIWMGYERKRGKLTDLNGLLRGGSRDRLQMTVRWRRPR